MIFNTKAQNLIFLKNKAKKINVLPLLCFPFSEYKSNKTIFLDKIINIFRSDVIVRSSAHDEDHALQSNAGAYKSILNVKLNHKSLMNAINVVGKDYRHQDDEILIQPMLKDIWVSGVIFTRDHSTGAPYYIINHTDDGKSDTITSGTAQGKKIIISRLGKINNTNHKVLLKQLIKTTKEIERVFGSDALDIEFAFNSQKILYILQVRPLIIQNAYSRSEIPDSLFFDHLKSLEKEIKNNSRKKSELDGKYSIYSMMTDWNPAEMIGSRPNLLALSLYKTLITDEIWAVQRRNYGYKDVIPAPLLYSFMGCPYIDVRTDFNSFLPANLSKTTSSKILQYYLDTLKRHPELHDKAEFSILFTCATLTTAENVKNKLAHILSQNQIDEFLRSLKNITNNIFQSSSPLYKKDILFIKKSEARYKSILVKNINFEKKIKELLNLCRMYGTLPFAGIARTAFVGKQFLDSFLEKKIITKQNYQDFICSISIIPQKIQADLDKLTNNKITKSYFLSKWGHLRPNSYDILSPRYDEDFDSYFNEKLSYKSDQITGKNFHFTQKQLHKIDILLKQEGLQFSAEHLINCIKESIVWREESKFIFTKILSRILSLVKEYAHSLSLSENDISYVSIENVIRQFKTMEEKKIFLREKIHAGKINYSYTKCIKLPEILTSAADIYYFEQNESIANFVTQRKITANVVSETELHKTNCNNKIVCLRAADPGYDFIFTKNISGLITQFGGANSHMSIRCLEQNIPAVIGVGEKRFNELEHADLIEIDALNKQVRIIR